MNTRQKRLDLLAGAFFVTLQEQLSEREHHSDDDVAALAGMLAEDALSALSTAEDETPHVPMPAEGQPFDVNAFYEAQIARKAELDATARKLFEDMDAQRASLVQGLRDLTGYAAPEAAE